MLSSWHTYFSILLNWNVEKSLGTVNTCTIHIFHKNSGFGYMLDKSLYCCKFQSIFCTTKNIYIKWQLKLQELEKLQKINCIFFLSFFSNSFCLVWYFHKQLKLKAIGIKKKHLAFISKNHNYNQICMYFGKSILQHRTHNHSIDYQFQ